MLALRFVHIAALQRFQIKADGGDRSFQLVRDSVNEAVVLFVEADFADQEAGVEDQTKDDGGEKEDAHKQQQALAPVEDDPADVECDRQDNQEDANHEKEYDFPSAACDQHGDLRGLYSGARADSRGEIS